MRDACDDSFGDRRAPGGPLLAALALAAVVVPVNGCVRYVKVGDGGEPSDGGGRDAAYLDANAAGPRDSSGAEDRARPDLLAADGPRPDSCRASCAQKSCGAKDGCGGRCGAGSGCLLLNDPFTTGPLDRTKWSYTANGTGSRAAVANGVLTIAAGKTANAEAEVVSKMTFGSGVTFEARVRLNAGQFYDHKGIGWSNKGVGVHCGATEGATDAIQWRGQDTSQQTQVMRAGLFTCNTKRSTYAAGWRTIKIVRDASRADFYEDNVLIDTVTTTLPSASMPVRISASTFTSGVPAAPVVIIVDWIRVRSQ